MTNIEFVSEIAGILKVVNKDNRIPRRLILRVGQEVVTTLLSQKLMDRTISSETNLFTRIECFEFEKIETKNCPSIEFRLCKTLMKSKNPLPKLVFSRLGASIKDIVSLDGDFTFTFVDESQYRRNKKRQNQLKNQVFIYLGSENHLYIPDREIISVDLVVLTADTINSESCSSCAEKTCKSNWEYPFIVPDKLIETVKDLTLQRLGFTRQIQEDQNPNNIEGA
jgi:hypothetical protein